jgi:hypothetical protein
MTPNLNKAMLLLTILNNSEKSENKKKNQETIPIMKTGKNTFLIIICLINKKSSTY